ncbi:PREDICTED: facilitated trehalose transporter Tret1-like [Ceratosolen solmsi marchali]|uniref:Facilitated trehalose transporter Tret1-like n=1 Tax=Ceratosolen solmsi marchali TaxID=326594 RepID=A0AAJ6YHI0_9HYME|nr:PREDICTED: facilitated trehalose transporter Tret1-like [Ceratosolen solmsi marchali]
MFLVGLANGWSSPYLAQLSLKETVDGIPKATDEQLSWVASLMNIGRIFGAAAGAVFQETMGRKMSLYFSGLPMMSGWICVAVATTVQWLYAARLLCGFAMGMIWTTLSLYLAEIADPEIRGSLILWNITTQSIGLFIGNLMGPYISMRVFSYISLVPNILFLMIFHLIPDSPYQHIMTGNVDKAEASLKWFRRKDNVKLELQELQDYVSSSKISLMDRLRELNEPRYRKSFMMMFLINIFGYFGAYNVSNNYMEIIVANSRANVTPSTIVTATGLCSIISGLLATFLVDKFGRRLLLVSSSLGMALSLTSLGLHFRLLDLGHDPKPLTWLPCICLLFYTISYSAGCGCIPTALMGELFSPKLKTITSLSFSGTSAVFSSLSTGTFLPFLNLIGANYLFWFFAAGVYISVVYYYFYMPETMGKSLKDIQQPISKS